ncbi:hypothetical protein EJ02DRAFT_39347 [Clathrospora elynae]|uniref:Uncharacterized protein n=1 Tax=Clathrospora elynae TaxID=706981 RepID=A0A6A5SE86_9PLEO|nr:hypothetical protein EJ02DRAFT_39347 [Clathrospora elynae]
MVSETKYQPYFEDYNSDESDGRVLESFQGRKSPNAANVSTKRSHPSDLDKEKPPAQGQERVPTNIDMRSDSGGASQRSPPVVAATCTTTPTAPTAPVPAQKPAPKPRRPTQSEQRQNSTKSSSPHPTPLARTASQAARPSTVTQRRTTITQDTRPERRERERRDSRVVEDCTDPTCTKCGPNALPPLRRPDLPPSQSARDVSYPAAASDNRSMRSDPAAYYASPPSPTYTRQSAYMQGPAIVQPSMPRRRSSTATRQQRPTSYSGEAGSQYWVPGMPAPYPSPPQEHGPPPSSSAAWRSMQQYQTAPMGQMGPPLPPYMQQYGQTPGYPQYPPNQQTSPPYRESQRPGIPSRTSSNYTTRNGSALVITQAPHEQPRISARHGPPPSATQPTFPTMLQIQDGAYDVSASESEPEADEEEYFESDHRDARAPRALMPPPKITRSKSKSRKQRPERPPIRHANTTQVSDVDRKSRRISQSLVIDEHPTRERGSRASNEPSRRMSVSRPAAPERRTQSDYATPRAHIVVNNSTKPSRRQSIYVSDRDKEFEAYAQAREREEKQIKVKARAEARALEARALEEAQVKAAHEERYQRDLERDRKRQSRNSKVYYCPPAAFDDDDDSEDEDESEEERISAPLATRRRRPTDVESHKGKERIPEPKSKRIENAAEDYISAKRGARDPYADQIHKAAKRASRVPSGPSHSGSSHEGSDKQSQSNRTAVTSNGNKEIRLRVDASAPLSLSFNGDMEGRTLRMIPAENGMADIVIGGSRGSESTYQSSERGSVAGSRKAIMASQARRDAEETMTERSSYSGRSRRDDRVVRESRDDREGQRQPLRRRGTDYRT